MKKELPEDIKEWAFWLSSNILGDEKIPLCRWARKSILSGSVDYYESDNPENLIPLPNHIRVRIISFPGKNRQEIINIRDRCNKISDEWIFLDSHPEDEKEIGGLKSVYKTPLILIQNRKELEFARKSLISGNYYSYWDKSDLDHILSI